MTITPEDYAVFVGGGVKDVEAVYFDGELVPQWAIKGVQGVFVLIDRAYIEQKMKEAI